MHYLVLAHLFKIEFLPSTIFIRKAIPLFTVYIFLASINLHISSIDIVHLFSYIFEFKRNNIQICTHHNVFWFQASHRAGVCLCSKMYIMRFLTFAKHHFSCERLYKLCKQKKRNLKKLTCIVHVSSLSTPPQSLPIKKLWKQLQTIFISDLTEENI